MKIAIMTDSNSGITQSEAKKLGIYVLPMPFDIDQKTYFEDIDLSPKEFFNKLREGSDVCTSQPSPADVTHMWDEILEKYDSLIYIPMSSGLSNSCQTAKALANEEEYKNKVFVSDTTRISVTQRQACLDALTLLKTCQSPKYICDYLEKTGEDASIYIAIDTMKYLKKGGRVTPAAAGIATVLGIKPVLLIKGGKLDSFAKVRGMKAAQDTMIEALKTELEGPFKRLRKEGKVALGIAYTGDKSITKEIEKRMEEEFSDLDIVKNPLSLSVACHTGEGALGVGCFRIEN